MAISKVCFGNNTLVDLTADTVTAEKLLSGYTAHDRTGALVTGSYSAGEEYIKSGLIVDMSNTANSWHAVAEWDSPILALSPEYSIEVCCTITSINTSTRSGMFFVLGNLFFGCPIFPEYIAPGSDYGISIGLYPSGTPGYATSVEGLNFGDMHTFSEVQKEGVVKAYIDGTYIGEFATTNSLSAQAFYVMCSSVSGHLPRGTWNNARIYNRALTTSELLANHAEDVRRYGI